MTIQPSLSLFARLKISVSSSQEVKPLDNPLSDTIIVNCADGQKVSLSQKLLVEHSRFFSSLINGNYADSRKNTDGAYEVKILQFSGKILSAVARFLALKELPAEQTISAEELLELNDAVDFFDIDEAAQFREAIAGRLKETEITADNASDWFRISNECENFPELKRASIEAIKENFWKRKSECTASASKLSNNELLNALETDHPFTNLSINDSREIYCKQLVKRLKSWLEEIDSGAHFSESRRTVIGKRCSFFKLKRKQLPRDVVKGLNLFAKRAHLFTGKTAETILSHIEKEIPDQPGKTWLQNSFTAL